MTSLHASLRCIGAAASEVVILCDALEDVPLWIKDVAGHYQWVNRSFLLNFGLEDRDEVLGKTDFDLCAPQLAELYRVDDERVLAGERIVGRVELIGRYDHTSRWCSTTKIPLHDPKGRVVGTAGITRPLNGVAKTTRGEPLSLAIQLISEGVGRSVSNLQLAQACGLSLRAFERQFPGQLSVHAAALCPAVAGAVVVSRPGQHPQKPGGYRHGIRVCRPKSLQSRVPPVVERNAAQLPRATPGLSDVEANRVIQS
jgi:PAS domain S-box-containing protein